MTAVNRTEARSPELLTPPAIRHPLVWSPARVFGAVALGAWAALFWWLLLTDRTQLYLSSRTAWVVPVGAIILTIAFAGRLASARSEVPETLERGRAVAISLIVVPVIVVMALPPVALGSFAASRRSSIAGTGFAGSAEGIATGNITLVDVAGALRSREGMHALAKRAGDDARFVGFVARDPATPANEFMLTRFVVSCCVADALSVQVRVVGAPPGQLANDEWVEASGSVYPLGREVILDASEVRSVKRPAHPYLNP
jgi:putative membrane protein